MRTSRKRDLAAFFGQIELCSALQGQIWLSAWRCRSNGAVDPALFVITPSHHDFLAANVVVVIPAQLHVRQHDGYRVRRVGRVNATTEGSTRRVDRHHSLGPTNDAALGCDLLDHSSDVRSDSKAPSRRSSFSGSSASRSRMRFSSVSRRSCSLTMSCWRSSSLRDFSARRNAPWASPARCSSKRRAIAEYDAPPSRSSSACSSTVLPGARRRGGTRSRDESLGVRLSVRLFELCLGMTHPTNPRQLNWRVDPGQGDRLHGWPFVPRIACTGQTKAASSGCPICVIESSTSTLLPIAPLSAQGSRSLTPTSEVRPRADYSAELVLATGPLRPIPVARRRSTAERPGRVDRGHNHAPVRVGSDPPFVCDRYVSSASLAFVRRFAVAWPPSQLSARGAWPSIRT